MISALALLTCIGRGRDPDPGAVRWFGAVGAVLGAIMAVAWWVASQWWNPLTAAVVVVAVDAGLTGILHLDGLADCGDGLLAPMDRDRRLVVMRDPAVGAFGLVAVVLALALNIAGLAGVEFRWWLLPGLYALSLSAAALVMIWVPYARPEGLASSFTTERGDQVAVVAALTVGAAVTVAAMVAEGPRGLVTVAAAVIGSAAVTALARRRLGGFTGDVLGAVIVTSQVGALLAASAVHPTLGAT